MRIVSLIPSATEIVCALGLRDQLVGVTHECDFPPDVAEIPKVTHTLIPTDASSAEIDSLVRGQLDNDCALYRLNHDAIRTAQPDLIISQTLCDVCAVADREVREVLETFTVSPRVIYLEPTVLNDVLESLRTVAAAANCPERGEEAHAALQKRIEAVRTRNATASRKKIVVLEWLDPLFSSGHWTPELVEIAGGIEPLAEAGARSREISIGELVESDPDMILVACCGFSIARTREDVRQFLAHPDITSLRCVRERQVFVVDGSAYFSRPGPRLVESLEILAHWMNPTENPLRSREEAAISAFV